MLFNNPCIWIFTINPVKILYVEDNKVNALVMKKILNEYDLAIAYNGPDGIQYATQDFFDLVLLDINLGSNVMDGCDVLRHLRAMDSYKTSPIFAITAFALPHERAHFRAQGFDKYFTKPLNYNILKKTISRLKVA